MNDGAAPLRIVHVTRSLDPSEGGLPAVAVRLACAAAEAGHRVTIICEQRGTIGDAYCGIPGWCDVNLIQLPLVPFVTGLVARPPTLLREAITGADLVHLHGAWDMLLVAAARSARELGIPYVVAPHGMLDPWSLSQRRLKKRLALAGPQGGMFRRAAALHALNADEAALWRPLGLTAPVHVIPNGIELRELPAEVPETGSEDFFQSRLGVSGDRVILFLGRLHYKKGLDLLGEAFAHLARRHPDWHLVAIGPDGGAAEMLRSMARRQNLSERVHLPGALFGPEKYAALRSAGVFCLPSRQEGFSVATLEAMACETPVVLSEDCHFDEAERVGAGRVVSLDVGTIAAALESVLADPEAARAMGRRGRELVERRYTWSRASDQAIEAYRQILAPHSSPLPA